MVQIPFGKGDWSSHSRHIARNKLRNMYIAQNPQSPEESSLYSRPSLKPLTTIGAEKISAMWRQDGTFGGDWFIIGGTSLYRFNPRSLVYTNIGQVFGASYAQFAGNEDRMVIVRDGVAYLYDGTSLLPIDMPDNLPVGTVAQIDGSFLLGVLNEFLFYWLKPGETFPDGLSYAAAERSPDPITSINILSDEIWMIGTDSVEVWAPTGDLDAPYSRIPGRTYTEGCVHRDTVVASSFKSYPCLIWTTHQGEVVLAQGQPEKISDDSVEEFLKSATNLRAWGFRRNRNDFYVLTADQGTYVFNISSPQWARWDSYRYEYWRAHVGLQDRTKVFAGDSETSTIYELVQESVDNGGDPIVCQTSAFLPHGGTYLPCDSVNVRVNSGWMPSYEGLEPIISLRISDDAGFTWSEPLHASLGEKGGYNTDIMWRSLGRIYRPGRFFELQYSGLQNLRIDYATMNEI